MHLARALQERRRIVLPAVAVLTVFLLIVALGIRFDFSPQAVYVGNGDEVEFSESVKEVFGHSDAVLLLLLEATGEDDVLAPAALTWTVQVADRVDEIPRILGSEALATLKLPRPGAGLSGFSFEPVVPELPADAGASERAHRALEEFSLLEGTLVRPDRRLAAILVFLDPEARRVDEMRPVIAAVDDLLERHPPPEGYRVGRTGLPSFRTDVVRDLGAEQASRIPLMAAAIVLVLLLVMRRLAASFLLLAAVGVGMAWTAGALVLTGHSLNVISNILPVILFTIGIANGVHIVNRYAEECRRSPASREVAARRTISSMATACMLTYLTTAVGFLSLSAARSRSLQEVGWQTAMGLALLYISAMLVLGALLSRVRPPDHPGTKDAPFQFISRFVSATGTAVARHPWPILAGSFLLIAGSLLSAARIPIDSRMLETYDEDHPVTRTLRLAEDGLGGVATIDVSLRADEPGRFLAPEVYRKVRAFCDWARTREEVLRARSYVDLHRDVDSRRVGGGAADDPDASRIRANHTLCRLFGSTFHYSAFLSKDDRRARVVLGVRDVGSKRLLQLLEAMEDRLASLFPSDGPIAARVTGDAILFAKGMDSFIRDLLISLLAAAAVIFGVIALLFRSPRLGLISMLPNLTPLVLTLGYMGVRGYRLNAANVIVFAISLGVAVDNTIHFLARLREERNRSRDLPEAIQRTFRGAGRAMVLTSLLVVIGLAFLHSSSFLPTRRFAELTSITMLAALVGDLYLLPACLVLFGMGSARSGRDA